MNWLTYPMGGKGAERAERMGRVAHLDHAVNTDTGKPLCSVKIDSLCMDSSLATRELPDCPRCRAVIARSLP